MMLVKLNINGKENMINNRYFPITILVNLFR